MKKQKYQKETEWLLREKHANKKTINFFNYLTKLKQGEPIDYLIGFKEFLHCKIDLSAKPLIPREETEYWTEKVVKENSKAKTFLDIFSGSGCIGVAILKNIKNSKVDFGEIDKVLMKQIKKNLKINNINQNRFNMFQSNIFKNIPRKRYDVITANPPYISLKNKKQVDNFVLNHEPHKALFAKETGLFFIKKIIKEAPNYLKETGKLYIEFDTQQKPYIEKITKKNKNYNSTFHKDQFGKWRFIKLLKK